ncbi:MAG: thioredoxin domain-containing protein, partial [Myxococcales bacterium]|nr:thioredoxin domain-containing protein [Myxococcales bacterium]
SLGISDGLVHQRLKRGREQLKEQINHALLEDLRALQPSKGFSARVMASVAVPIVPAAATGTGVSPPAATGWGQTLGSLTAMKSTKIAAITIIALLLVATLVVVRDKTRDEAKPTPTDGAAVVSRSLVDTAHASKPSPVTPSPLSTRDQGASPLQPADESNPGTALDSRVAPTEEEQVVSFQIELEGESEAVWYRLQEVFPDCARVYLEDDSVIEETGQVRLRFSNHGESASLTGAKILHGTQGPAQEAFEACVSDALADAAFPKDTGEVTVAFSYQTRTKTPMPDAETLSAMPMAIGSEAVGPSRGAENARVTLVIFTDFQCTYCSRALATMDELLEFYSADLRVVTKLFPLKPESRRLAEATAAAALQHKFWPMHDLIFANQDVAKIGESEIMAFAKQSGLDTKLFLEDWNSQEVADIVQQDLDDGHDLGVRGTPTTFVNQAKIVGAQPIESFKTLIDAELLQQ